jgi:hypothetical protein
MALMKRLAWVALGFILGLLAVELSSELMTRKYGEQYGVIRRDVSLCELQQSGCSGEEDFGGLMKGTPFRLHGDLVLEVRLRIAPSRVKEVLDFRDEEWAEKMEKRMVSE